MNSQLGRRQYQLAANQRVGEAGASFGRSSQPRHWGDYIVPPLQDKACANSHGGSTATTRESGKRKDERGTNKHAHGRVTPKKDGRHAGRQGVLTRRGRDREKTPHTLSHNETHTHTARVKSETIRSLEIQTAKSSFRQNINVLPFSHMGRLTANGVTAKAALTGTGAAAWSQSLLAELYASPLGKQNKVLGPVIQQRAL